MDEEFENLCAHEVSLQSQQGVITIEPSGIECRVKRELADTGEYGGVKVYRKIYGDVINLPPKKKGVMYIVSSLVLDSLNGSRNDVVAPTRMKEKSGRKYSIGLKKS